jgi:hypothetical protein
MKFYVTGRSSNYPRVEAAVKEIKERGHEITFEWSALPMAKPFSENQAKATEYAMKGIQGVIDADVYIIFVHKDGNGVFTEFGAALASNAIKGTPLIFAIGDEKEAMFYYHPALKWRTSVADVLDELEGK